MKYIFVLKCSVENKVLTDIFTVLAKKKAPKYGALIYITK